MISFVLGGAKSGKTKWALRYGEGLTGFKEFYYLATAIAFDEEMKRKIERHQEERSSRWILLEEPLEVPLVLKKLRAKEPIIILDCLTVWLSNLLHYKRPVESYMENLIKELTQFKEHYRGWIIIVSNEVGLGLVPERELGRTFRDLAGLLNQRVAELADEVFFIVAGLSLSLKGRVGETNSGYLP